MPKRTRLDTGIYQDAHGISVTYQTDGRTKEHRFPLKTPLSTLRGWRNRARALRREEIELAKRLPGVQGKIRSMKKSEHGHCYIYFIRCRDCVKIGRAVDPGARLRRLQTAHPEPLSLLAAVPAHHTLEAVLHRRFEPLRTNGEWFRVDEELAWFVRRMAEGVNPIALLWLTAEEQLMEMSRDRFRQNLSA